MMMSRSDNSPNSKIPVISFEHETDLAICVKILDESMKVPAEKAAWFPKSQVRQIVSNDIDKSINYIVVAGWIAKKYGY